MTQARWTLPARDDLARIGDFYYPIAPDFADRLTEAALSASRFLAANPQAGPALKEPVRKWRIGTFDYVLLYRVTAGGVEILRIHHAREGCRKL